MIKKSVIAVLATAATVASSSYAAENGSMSVEQRLDQMQAQINTLKKDDQKKDKIIESLKASHSSHADGNYLSINSSAPTKSNGDHNSTRHRGTLYSMVHLDTSKGKSTTFEEFPSSKIPLSMLQVKNKFGRASDRHRALVFGGYLEADTQGWWGKHYQPGTSSMNKSVASANYSQGAGVYLTTANLDVMANLNNWTQTYMVVSATQSSISLQQAFVTFGNLDKFPLFATIGKNRIPFGAYAGGGPWISSIAQGLFRPSQFTNVTVAYAKDGLNTNLSLFTNKAEHIATGPGMNSQTEGHTSGDFMYSVFYNGAIGNSGINYGFNTGYLYNLANTTALAGQIIQNGEAANIQNRNIQNRNSVINFEGHMSYSDFSVMSGWFGTTVKQQYTNNSRAGAWYVQANYSPAMRLFGSDRETVFSVAYNGAYNTQLLPMSVAGEADPGVQITGVQKEVVASAQREVMSQVFLGLEYGWLGMYDKSHTNELTLDTSVYF